MSLQVKAKICNIELQKSHTWRSCGSSYGWLVIIDKNMVISLLNPFKDRITIDFPEIEVPNPKATSHQYTIHKVILSINPLLHPNSYVVVVIHSIIGILAFYKAVQRSWIYLDDNLKAFIDIVFHKNLVYGIGNWKLELDILF